MDTLKQMKSIRFLYLLAALCFVPTLFFYYVGEEGVFTLNSMEMWQRHEFMSTVMYGEIGGGGGRPPLFNWLMIPVANMIGWENVLVASRIVTVAATMGTSLIIGWLAQQLWREKMVSWTAALLYLLTADVLLYRGWLSYADPLFATFVVLAIALAWVACLRNSYLLLAAAMLAAFAAFMTKALTVYVFLGISMMVLFMDVDYRRFLLRPQAWAVYVFAILLLLIWFKSGTHDTAQHVKMSSDILGKFAAINIGDYLVRLVSYPLEMFLRLMPASLFAGYFLIRKRDAITGQHPAVWMALLMALLNFLPYWLAPYGGPRYVLPIYPLLVLPAAYLVVRQADVFNVKRWMLGMLVIGTAMNFIAYPYYQKVVRGENYVRMAEEITDKYGQYPLYTTNVSSIGLSVVANMDSMHFGQPGLTLPPADFRDGIVIAYTPNDVPGDLLRTLRVDNDTVYLICRGAACAADK
jgi:4-amino-4-deoxy-L-arabinose transferase-like glycosyltransferase